MPEFIAIHLKRAAIALAEELSYDRAAITLNITPAELRQQIASLEDQLYLHVFQPKFERMELTEEGRFLIEIFRKCLVLHDRNHQ